MFERIRTRIARALAPPRRSSRTYAGAKYNRLTAGWHPSTGSSDSELWSSLTALRNRSRQLIRDNAYAKRAKLLVVNNVIGSGIEMEAQVRLANGKLNKAVNDAIEAAYCDWSRAENCHTGGKLSFPDLERQAFGQIFEAGEVLVRKHYRAFGTSKVPLGLELVEAERLADDLITPVGAVAPNYYRLGLERDEFGRPQAFWLRKYHPGEFQYASGADDPNALARVPAEQMFHLYVCDRWPQTRGEPWLHAAMRRLNDMDGYAEAEIVRARAAACRLGLIQSPDEAALPNDEQDQNAVPQFDLEPGLVQRLAPGETWIDSNPTAPNPTADPFMRLMLREVAAGIGASYASLSMDYSQSNYSSSRLALLDDRDLWRVFQQFFIRSFREPLHREWLELAVMARAIPAISVTDFVANTDAYQAVSFKPRGWSWIDPAKEVEAYLKARRAGFMTTSQIASLTGAGDIDDLWTQLAAENEDAVAKGLVLTSDAGQILEGRESNPTAAVPVPTEVVPPDADAGERRVTELSMVRQERAFEALALRVAESVSRVTALAVRDAMANVMPQPTSIVNISPQPVHINTPDIKVDVAPPSINVVLPEQPIHITTPDVKVDVAAPNVNVVLPEQPIHVTTPDVKVDIAAPVVNVETPQAVAEPEAQEQVIEVMERDEDGFARTIRRRDAVFDVLERDEAGNATRVRKRSAA